MFFITNYIFDLFLTLIFSYFMKLFQMPRFIFLGLEHLITAFVMAFYQGEPFTVESVYHLDMPSQIQAVFVGLVTEPTLVHFAAMHFPGVVSQTGSFSAILVFPAVVHNRNKFTTNIALPALYIIS